MLSKKIYGPNFRSGPIVQKYGPVNWNGPVYKIGPEFLRICYSSKLDQNWTIDYGLVYVMGSMDQLSGQGTAVRWAKSDLNLVQNRTGKIVSYGPLIHDQKFDRLTQT